MDFGSRTENDTLVFILEGRLTFTDSQKFDDILNVMEKEDAKKCVFDFRDLEFIDSSGLSMLLLARDMAGNRNLELVFRSPRGEVRDRLDFARFNTIVTMED